MVVDTYFLIDILAQIFLVGFTFGLIFLFLRLLFRS